ncbi:arginyltransferase [bacterium]|nr:arginyltransferase [bacterium]
MMDKHKLKAVREIVQGMKLTPGKGHPCSYIAQNWSKEIAFKADMLPPGVYHCLMDLGFRRSGDIFYKPVCSACTACRPIRIPVDQFTPDRTQSRIFKKNRDIDVQLVPPNPTHQKYELYKKYIVSRHSEKPMSADYDDFVAFLYGSPIETRELEMWLDGKLIGVGILDLEPEAVSAVYFYYDLEYEKRSLGTYNILWGIEYTRRNRVPYYYMGYYVEECRKMNYKTRFEPYEILEPSKLD